jgi:hypothetical protein
MKEKDYISMYLKKIKVNRYFGDIDKKDKEEIKKLDDSFKEKLIEMDEEHLDILKCNIINRRYELDNHLTSLSPNLWSIGILIDDVYQRYIVKKSIDDILKNDDKKKVKKK